MKSIRFQSSMRSDNRIKSDPVRYRPALLHVARLIALIWPRVECHRHEQRQILGLYPLHASVSRVDKAFFSWQEESLVAARVSGPRVEFLEEKQRKEREREEVGGWWNNRLQLWHERAACGLGSGLARRRQVPHFFPNAWLHRPEGGCLDAHRGSQTFLTTYAAYVSRVLKESLSLSKKRKQEINFNKQWLIID